MRSESAKRGWDANRETEAENNMRQFLFWEQKLHMALNKGNKKAEEEARKHLDYWKDLI